MERASPWTTSTYKEEFQWRLQEALAQDHSPASKQSDLDRRDAIRKELWYEAFEEVRV
ncbi:Hypothetical predicted protein [Pelobates cultripes]|uniref:Uncharacterized protein n=1 Tax=Pelobates cultripes TaxID=61616 RepID=A0AAD1RG57_PELCU|nr:Hypothetical predicted protein [Pelobates cultripes]